MNTSHTYRTVLERIGTSNADVAVTISLYNYEKHIVEALQSVHEQDLETLDLVVVEDKSTDGSLEVAREWLASHGRRFNSFRLVQHTVNRGLPTARNLAFSLAECEFVFVLDADNVLYPRCVRRCLDAIRVSGAEFAYPILVHFGEDSMLTGYELWSVEKLATTNYIDAMSLIRTSAWKSVGGYSKMIVPGWEDYDLWCKFAEMDYSGVQVPEILARYRVSRHSMLRATTYAEQNKPILAADMHRRHPWLTVFSDLLDD